MEAITEVMDIIDMGLGFWSVANPAKNSDFSLSFPVFWRLPAVKFLYTRPIRCRQQPDLQYNPYIKSVFSPDGRSGFRRYHQFGGFRYFLWHFTRNDGIPAFRAVIAYFSVAGVHITHLIGVYWYRPLCNRPEREIPRFSLHNSLCYADRRIHYARRLFQRPDRSTILGEGPVLVFSEPGCRNNRWFSLVYPGRAPLLASSNFVIGYDSLFS